MNWYWGIAIALNLLVLIGGAIGFIKVIGNDLTHLAIDVKEIKADVKEIKEEQTNQGNRISIIETRCKERYPRRKRN